eukprot:scaffold174687_cov32-Attheya_sp.AAC.1
MSPPVSDAAASDDSDSSPDILGTTKVPGQPKRRRLKTSKAEAVPASLSTGIHPPAKKKSRTLKPSSTPMDAVQRHPTPLRMMSSVSSNVESIAGPSVITDPYLYVAWSNATQEEQDNGDWKKSAKAPMRADQKKPPRRQLSRSLASDESSKPSSKPSSSSSSSSTHMDAVQRRPTPLRMMSTVSSNVESIVGSSVITDPYLYVAWSNATQAEQDNGDWKKSAKAPMRADQKKPPRRQTSRAPKFAKAPTHPDSDASDTSSDEEDKMVLSKKSCKAPLGVLPPSPDDDDDSADGDGDEISTPW